MKVLDQFPVFSPLGLASHYIKTKTQSATEATTI